MRFKSKSDDFHIAFYIAQGYSKETLKKIGLPFGFLVAKKKKRGLRNAKQQILCLKTKSKNKPAKKPV